MSHLLIRRRADDQLEAFVDWDGHFGLWFPGMGQPFCLAPRVWTPLPPDVAERLAPASPRPPAEITVDVRGCARCHGDGHEQLTFRELTHPVEFDDAPPLTHWATCPTSGEPILMRIAAAPGR